MTHPATSSKSRWPVQRGWTAIPRPATREKVASLIASVGLPDMADRYPA